MGTGKTKSSARREIMIMFRIEVKKSAQKELFQLPSNYKNKIIKAIDGLVFNPRTEGCKKLKGIEAYRIRVFDYRIVYIIQDKIQLIEIQRIRHRKDVYK